MENKNKRIIAVFLALISLAFTACNNSEKPSNHQCSFTEKVETDKYLKSEATCQEGAQYYYSCQCGERSNEYFDTTIKAKHTYTAEVASAKYLKKAATCEEPAVYYKSCAVCGDKSFAQSFVYGESCECNYIKETVDELYLKSEATFEESAVYYKSCSWCGRKGEETFSFGEPLKSDYTDEEKAAYKPTSLTVTLYNAQESVYGFTYNTQIEPLRPVIQIEKGDELTQNRQEYAARVEEAISYSDDNKVITYYIVKVEIPLEQSTTYTYRAYDKYVGVGTENVTLETKNTKATAFTFAHVSDSQGSNVEFGKVLGNISNSVEFLLHTGDVVESSKYESDWYYMLQGNFKYLSKIPMMAISGNHETTYKNGSNETYKHFNNQLPTQASTLKGYFYSFVYGNVKFIMLNTNDLTSSKLKDEQYNWLVNELKNNTATWTIVAMHNPMYSVGNYGANPSKNAIALALQKQLQGIFVEYGVDVVLQGHDHAISRTYPIDAQGQPKAETWQTDAGIEYSIDPNGVIYVMDGPSGEQWRTTYSIDESLYHYAEASKARSWAEYSIDGLTLQVSVKYYDGTQIQTYHTWGIKKTASNG